MAFRTLAATASLALVAEAFMIPSTISLPGVEVNDDGEFTALRMPDALPEQLKNLNLGVSKLHMSGAANSVLLDCPGCSFDSTDDEDLSVENDLVLDFNIDNNRKTLSLNGSPFFPLRAQNGPATAYQRTRETGEESNARTLEYDAISSSIAAADGTDAQLIDLSIFVKGIEDEAVNVDGVDVRMLQDESGDLHLVHIVTRPTHGAPQNGFTKDTEIHNPPPESKDACPAAPGLATMICRLRAQIKQKVEDWRLMQPNEPRPHKLHKPCPGRRPHFLEGGDDEARPPFLRGGPPKFMNSLFPQRFDGNMEDMPRRFHHHDHRHGLVHGFASALRAFVLGFVVPVLIGVIAGMSASLLGMLVGTLIAWMWVTFVRGGKRGNSSARQTAREMRAEEECLIGEKDVVLLDHAPAYEDGEAPPIYVEKQ